MKGKKVIKIGGSVLKTSNDLNRLIQIVGSYNEPIIIVVSAFSGITELLIEEALSTVKSEKSVEKLVNGIVEKHHMLINNFSDNHYLIAKASMLLEIRANELKKFLLGSLFIGELPSSVYDEILSYGERLSSMVCATALESAGFQCKEKLCEDIGLLVKTDGTKHTIDIHRSEKNVRESLMGNEYFVLPGFYGVSENGKTVLLGRGGSDYTAAAIARCVFAESLDLWKDCEGFLSADPCIVQNPVSINKLHYDEAAELAYFGAKILHPRTVEPLREKTIPIRIFSSPNGHPDNPVSVIDDKYSETDQILKSISCCDDFCVLKLNGQEIGIGNDILSNIIREFENSLINVKGIVTSHTAISVILQKKDIKKAYGILFNSDVLISNNIETIDDLSVVALVGYGIFSRPGIVAKIFNALAESEINIELISFGASPVVVFIAVRNQNRDKTIKTIHKQFFIN